MWYIDEEQYAESMQNIVEPYIAAFRTSGYTERVKGQPVYYEAYQVADARGVIVISHGFTESTAKYAESIYYMLQRGYDVWIQDHRGHGRSYRHVQNPLLIHVEHFEDYVLDLRFFIETRVKPQSGNLPLYLYSHSMGGCIGAWLIEDQPFLFTKAVLSSPMLGIDFGNVPELVLRAYAGIQQLRGKALQPSSAVDHFEREPDFEHSCDSCEARYLYYHAKRLADERYQTTTASIGWGLEAVKATRRVISKYQCSRIQIPVLLFSAELDDVVRGDAQETFAARTAQCELVRVPGVKHEIYMSHKTVLREYWEKLFAFLR